MSLDVSVNGYSSRSKFGAARRSAVAHKEVNEFSLFSSGLKFGEAKQATATSLHILFKAINDQSPLYKTHHLGREVGKTLSAAADGKVTDELERI